MQPVRYLIAAACTLLVLAPAALAQRTPAGPDTVRIENLTPDHLVVANQPATLLVEGRGFDGKAVVRIRVKGERGSGIDYNPVVEGPRRLRLTVPVDVIQTARSLELRVKNPDDMMSDWVTLEVRAASTPGPGTGGGGAGSKAPVIEYLTPSEIGMGTRNPRITIHGERLVDGATVLISSQNGSSEERGSLVSGTLVFPLPMAHALREGPVTIQVRNPDGTTSGTATLTVEGAPANADTTLPAPASPFITRVDPTRVDLRGAASQTIGIEGRGFDREDAFVLLRREGSAERAERVPVVARTATSDGVRLSVEVTPAMVPEPGFYELRVANPTGRFSSWARFEVANVTPTPGTLGAVVDARFPETIVLTATSTTLPVEVSVRNSSRERLRVSDFRLVTADGTTTPVNGTIDLAPNGRGSARLEVPVPYALGLGGKRAGVKVPVALVYRIAEMERGGSAVEARTPAEGFTTVTVRNEVTLEGIGREFVRDPAIGNTEGWRFFKTANEANEGVGRTADFYLLPEPSLGGQRMATDELWNYRPDPSNAADRGLFFLTLRGDEITTRDPRGRDRGTRLGYLVTNEAPGLVPLYRWVLMDGRRAVNHYLTIENEASKLPRQAQGQNWRLDRVVGYVVPRTGS